MTDTSFTPQRSYSDGMATRTNEATGEALLVPGRKAWRKISPITNDLGKWRGDKRVADGCVVAMKQGNSCGAKAPYC